MLNKAQKPTFSDMIEYSEASGTLWLELEKFLEISYDLQKVIRFPYGKDYGWSVKYSHKTKHICDVFAEKNAFTVFFKIDDKDIDGVKDEFNEESLKACDDKYPCSGGGWVSLRVLKREQLIDAQRLLTEKVKPRKVQK